MGKINEFQRQRLQSEAVGTPGVDQSGVEIGNTVGKVADAFITRQHALDNAEIANAFYSYQRQDDVERLKLQDQFKSQPEAFEQAYTETNSKLTRSFRDQLPERSRSRFDTFVNRRNASVVPENQKWLFGAQNAKGLDLANMTGNEFVMAAQTWGGADRYLEETAKYRETFQRDLAPLLLNPDKAEEQYIKSATTLHLDSMLDLNQGNPVKLLKDLETNEPFKKALVETLGAAKFEQYQKAAEKQVRNLDLEQVYDTYTALTSPQEIDRMDAWLTGKEQLSVAKLSQEVLTIENAIQAHESHEDSARAPEQLAVLKSKLDMTKLLQEIAVSRGNQDIKPDPVLEAQLQDMLMGFEVDIPKGEKLAEASVEVQGAVSKTVPRPESFGKTVLSNLATQGPFALLGVSGKNTSARAPENHSKHLINMYRGMGAVLTARAQKRITDQQASKLLTRFAKPLATFEQYDLLAKGDSPFVKMREAADTMARNLVINMPKGTPTEELRNQRIAIRSKIMERYAVKKEYLDSVHSRLTPGEQLLKSQGDAAIQKSVIEEFASAFNYGAAKGRTIITADGTARNVVDIDQRTGRVIFETPKNLNKSLKNT